MIALSLKRGTGTGRMRWSVWLLCLLTLMVPRPFKAQINAISSSELVGQMSVNAPWLPLKDLLEQAHRLKAQQSWAPLLELLHPLEPLHAGDPEFDRFLGQAASRAGALTRAILAYERLWAAYPDDPVIQAEMATLLFRTGENKRSKELFESLLAQPLPDDVRGQVGHYLGAIRDRTVVVGSDWQFWSVLSAGHDSNVNAGSVSGRVHIPGFPAFYLLPDDPLRRKASSTHSAQIGVRWVHRVKAADSPLQACQLMGEGSAQDTRYERLPTYDGQGLVLEAAITCPMQDRRQSWQVGVQATKDWRAQDVVRETQALRGLYFWDWPGVGQLTLSAQTGGVQYPLDPRRKGQRHGASLGWMSKLGDSERWLVGASAGVATEEPDSSERKHQGVNALNVQGHLRYRLGQRTALQFYVSQEHRRHMAEDVLFQSLRRDRQRLLAVNFNWTPNDRIHAQWSFGLSRLQNTSSIDLYSYHRIAPTVTWRAAF